MEEIIIEEEDKVSSIRIKETVKDKLKPYKTLKGSYEKAIEFLIECFENP